MRSELTGSFTHHLIFSVLNGCLKIIIKKKIWIFIIQRGTNSEHERISSFHEEEIVRFGLTAQGMRHPAQLKDAGASTLHNTGYLLCMSG